MSNYIRSSNPFEDDEEEEDFVVVNNHSSSRKANPTAVKNKNFDNLYSQSGSQQWNTSGDVSNPFDARRENIQRQIDNSENSQLESTQKALASIYESEAMGIATAEELIRQGETLDNIENKTTTIQNTLKTSQRHLNSIKSVFGGIKNWWKGDKSILQEEGSSIPKSRLRETVAQNEHAEGRRNDFSGFYDDNERDLDARFMSKAPRSTSSSGGYSMISPVTRSAREEEVDENLGMMCDGMARLKGLASELGNEIDDQNRQLDRINDKVEVTDDLVKNQNTQMRRILKK